MTALALLAADEPGPLTVGRMFGAWEVDPWLLAGLALVGAVYVAGVVRLARRGIAWPVGRTVAFVGGGLGTIVVATMSALGVYDDTLLTDHMIQHMVLAMVSPVFLALGAPVTLALRAGGPRTRQRILAVLHSRVARLLTYPPIAWLHFVALPFALYMTAWYPATLHHAALHELLHAQFVLAGCVFFFPILGLDPMPRRYGYPARMMMTFLAIPFHAILGVSIMMQKSLIAGDYYRALGRTWGPTLAADQNMAGAVMWVSGDLIGLLFFSTIFFQWQRAEDRTARREDRRLDRLDRIAARTATAAGPTAAGPASAGSASAGAAPAVLPAQGADATLTRPWWEVDPGPLAERARRQHWSSGGEPAPPA